MGLDVAIDELYASGWTPSDERDCDRHDDGRCFPRLDRVIREAKELGFELNIRHIQLFDCYRAEWGGDGGGANGAVVGQSDSETAVYALAQVRRSATPAGV